MRLIVLGATAVAVAAVATAVASGDGPPQTTLLGRAVLPARTFAPGPPSGQFIGPGPINGEPVPFPSQPVQGFSAVLPANGNDFWVMPDNGYGAKGNSSDFLLRMYRMTPHFKTKKGGSGTVAVKSFIQLRDPDHQVPFAIVNGGTADRLLTGDDFDIESVRKVDDGTLWFGDEFGPFLLHTDATGKVLEAPVPIPGVKSPQSPFLAPGETPTLPASGGFEGMAMAQNGRTVYPMLEKAVTGDDPSFRRVYDFDLSTRTLTRKWYYRVDDPSNSIGDFTQLDNHRFVVIERDQNQGAAAALKRIYEVDLRNVGPDGSLVKTEVVDLLDIADPAGISLPGRSGDIGLGTTFSFPYVTIEDVLPLGGGKLLVINDNNYPFSTGRNPSLPDYEDFIELAVPGLGR